jgi:hypothetical protein
MTTAADKKFLRSIKSNLDLIAKDIEGRKFA